MNVMLCEGAKRRERDGKEGNIEKEKERKNKRRMKKHRKRRYTDYRWKKKEAVFSRCDWGFLENDFQNFKDCDKNFDFRISLRILIDGSRPRFQAFFGFKVRNFDNI